MKPKFSKPSDRKTFHVTRGCVFEDIGFSPAEALELRVKSKLYHDLLNYIRSRGLSQQELGTLLGIRQVNVSHLLNGRVSKFSVGELIRFAAKLNFGAQIKLTEAKTEKSRAVTASGKARKKEAAIA